MTLDIVSARRKVAEFLVSRGWTTNVTGTNYTNEKRLLEFKVGTSYGEVAVHVRQGRKVLEIIRIMSEASLETALRDLDQLMDDSDLEAAVI